jgi:phage tail protein X
MKSYSTISGDMLDLVCWRAYGEESGTIERVLEDPNNYRISDLYEVLPVSTLVKLPDIDPVRVIQIKLWE